MFLRIFFLFFVVFYNSQIIYSKYLFEPNEKNFGIRSIEDDNNLQYSPNAVSNYETLKEGGINGINELLNDDNAKKTINQLADDIEAILKDKVAYTTNIEIMNNIKEALKNRTTLKNVRSIQKKTTKFLTSRNGPIETAKYMKELNDYFTDPNTPAVINEKFSVLEKVVDVPEYSEKLDLIKEKLFDLMSNPHAEQKINEAFLNIDVILHIDPSLSIGNVLLKSPSYALSSVRNSMKFT